VKILERPACLIHPACDGDAIVVAPIDRDGERLREVFLSMPALCLTVEQVARLLHVPVVSASQLLASLERDGFLMRTTSGQYRIAQPLMC